MARRLNKIAKRKKRATRTVNYKALTLQKVHTAKIATAKQFVLNLSKHPITYSEYLLLAKGLKFIPSPKHNNENSMLMRDYNEFARKLRCKYHFHENDDSNLHPFRIKSGYIPDLSSQALENYI